MTPSPYASSTPFDRPISDLRRAALARRISAPPATFALISELCWPPRDGAPVAIRVMPSDMEDRLHG